MKELLDSPGCARPVMKTTFLSSVLSTSLTSPIVITGISTPVKLSPNLLIKMFYMFLAVISFRKFDN